MKEIGLEELKVIQMDILSTVHRFCVSHNMRYSLDCGTLLGCVRHKGYIPWDDDIDICVLREDYDRMIKEFPETLEGKYKFMTLERSGKWDKPFGKIYDDTTILQEERKEPYRIGVNIDVFPIDKVPEDKKAWEKYDRKRRKLQNIFLLRMFGMDDVKIFKFHKDRSLGQNLMMAMEKFMLKMTPIRPFAKYLQYLSKKYNRTTSSHAFQCCQGIFAQKPFQSTVFDNIVMMQFEDREYMAFAEYDTYLTCMYGNWRELPPVEKRVSHHKFKAWWKDEK